MSKEHKSANTIREAEKIAGYHCKEVEEMALDLGKRMMRDQVEWLDVQMKDILTPELYEAGKNGDREADIAAYIAKHKIRIVFIPDSMAIQITIGDRIHSRFVPEFTVDGEKVDRTPKFPFDTTRN